MPKLTGHMKCIIKHLCYVVPGLGNSGRRYGDTNKSKWGGKIIRLNDIIKAHWMHDDDAGCTTKLIEEAVWKVEKVDVKCKMDVAHGFVD